MCSASEGEEEEERANAKKFESEVARMMGADPDTFSRKDLKVRDQQIRILPCCVAGWSELKHSLCMSTLSLPTTVP